MKERMKKILAVILAIFTIVTINYFYTTGIKKVEKIQLEKNLNTKEFVYNNVNIKESNYGKDIYKVAHNKEITPFSDCSSISCRASAAHIFPSSVKGR